MSKSETFHALNLELHQQQSFIRYFNNLPENIDNPPLMFNTGVQYVAMHPYINQLSMFWKFYDHRKPPSTVRFFNRTDYYTLHGEDANIGADFTSAAIKYMGDQPKLSYVCVNKSNFELLLRELLLVRQYRVEVYIKASQKGNEWNLEYKGSPGNLTQFEDLLFENATIDYSNSVMGVRITQNKVLAISCINITEAKFEVCEISDNECFSELEAVVAQIGPKECIIPSGDSSELVSLKNVLERNGILVAKIKKSDFSDADIGQDLNRLLYFHEDQQRNANALSETNLKEAMGCLQAVIRFLNLTADERNFNQFKLSTLDARRFVRLDNAALYALNVLPKPGSQTAESSILNPNANKTNSLKGILDNCVTAQGRRLLEQWIKQPLKDYNLINDRLDVVEALVKDAETRTLLVKDNLPRITDLMTLSRKLSCKKARLQECYRVYQTISSIPSLIQVLRNTENKCVKAMLINPISDIISDLQNYQNMIEQTIDLELVDRGEFLVKCSFDDDLNALHLKKDKVSEKMQKLLRLAAEDLGFEEGKTIKLECNDQYGYFFRVTLKEEHALRKSKNYKILDAIKGGVRFTNSKLTDLNQDYESIKEEYMERQKSVVDEIFEVAAGYADSLRNLNILLATVDVFASFAVAAVSARIPYIRPRLHKKGTGVLKLKKVRHPCLEAQDHVSFIPNNVDFNQSDKVLHIITGPNMCGKSTYIRSVGTCVLMAHIGSLVPCEEADISLVDGILVRVGADDCQLKGLSTFMLEMIETSTILKSATINSLVIIDELGRGTSTYDGCGIAWSIAEHLAKEIKCFSLFATHYHEISRLADRHSCVGNSHVTAVTTNNTITPLYQVREGECDKSYGVHCARMVDFPDDVIKDSIGYQEELEHYNGMKFISNFEQTVKRKIIGDGDAIVKEAIKRVKTMDIDKMSDGELSDALTNIKSDLESKNNLFIKGLLSI